MKIFSFLFSLVILFMCYINSVDAQLEDSPWPMLRHDPQSTGKSQYEGPEIPGLLWKKNQNFSAPIIASDGTLYLFLSDEGYLYAINPDSSEKWRLQFLGYFYGFPALGKDGRIFIFTGDYPDYYFYSINPDGSESWKIYSENRFWHPLIIDDDGVIYSCDDDLVIALNPDGSEKWLFHIDNTYSNFCTSLGKGNDGIIYVCSIKSFYPEHGTIYYLYAIDQDGSELWHREWEFNESFDVTLMFYEPVIDSNGVIYIAFGQDYDYFLKAIAPENYEKWSVQWKYEESSKIGLSRIAIDSNNNIYVCSSDRNMDCPLKTGHEISYTN